MIETAVIYWNVSPEIFQLGPLQPRWYGLCFAGGFLLAYQLFLSMYLKEGKSELEVYKLLLYTFVGTLVGARLGHVIFYSPEYYFSNPLDILKIWHGGLASHGGTAGVFVALIIYQQRRKVESLLWILDRASIVAALTAAFIRLGNLFNSEILGTPTDLPWAFVFERVDNIPRHPAQLYESLAYLLLFFFLRYLYQKYKSAPPTGLIFGLMLTGIFGSRFMIEYVKVIQEPFEAGWVLHMGQLLSIPFILAGVWLIWRAMSKSSGAKHV